MEDFAGAVIGIAVGGVLLSALKVFFSLVWDVIKIAISGQFWCIDDFINNLEHNCSNCKMSNYHHLEFFYYINYLRKDIGIYCI